MIKYKSNLNNLLKLFKDNISDAMDACAISGVSAIKRETPVITGELKDANRAEAKSDSVDFINEKDYASYVELGTYKQTANSFMRRGLINNLSNFKNIIYSKLKL